MRFNYGPHRRHARKGRHLPTLGVHLGVHSKIVSIDYKEKQ